MDGWAQLRKGAAAGGRGGGGERGVVECSLGVEALGGTCSGPDLGLQQRGSAREPLDHSLCHTLH